MLRLPLRMCISANEFDCRNFREFISKFSLSSIPPNEFLQNKMWETLCNSPYFQREDMKKALGTFPLSSEIYSELSLEAFREPTLSSAALYNTEFGKLAYEIYLEKFLRGKAIMDNTSLERISNSPFCSNNDLKNLLLKQKAVFIATCAKQATRVGRIAADLLVSNQECLYSQHDYTHLMERIQVYIALTESQLSPQMNHPSFLASIFKLNARPFVSLQRFHSDFSQPKHVFTVAMCALASIYYFLHHQFNAANAMQLVQQKDFVHLLEEISSGKIKNYKELTQRLKSTENNFFINTGLLRLFAPTPPYVEIRANLLLCAQQNESTFSTFATACSSFLSSLTQVHVENPLVKRLQEIYRNPFYAMNEVNKDTNLDHLEMR